MRKKVQAILLQVTFGLTKMENYYGQIHLKIRQYMTSMQAAIEALDRIFLDLVIHSDHILAV
jgi:hypothetical protein